MLGKFIVIYTKGDLMSVVNIHRLTITFVYSNKKELSGQYVTATYKWDKMQNKTLESVQ